MLKIFFPAGLKFDQEWFPQSHHEVFESFYYGQDNDEKEKLLTRVFSLFPCE